MRYTIEHSSDRLVKLKGPNGRYLIDGETGKPYVFRLSQRTYSEIAGVINALEKLNERLRHKS